MLPCIKLLIFFNHFVIMQATLDESLYELAGELVQIVYLFSVVSA